jgi:hypothetical protein
MRAETSFAIAVFARAPVPGQAKTRLIPRLGAEGAARLQARLIEQALDKACAVRGASVTLWLAGESVADAAADAAADGAADAAADGVADGAADGVANGTADRSAGRAADSARAGPSIAQAPRRAWVATAPQVGADLGARMAHAFAQTLAPVGRATRCVLIGTDCPALTSTDLEAAAHALLTHDVVVQPAVDGGYVLIGLRAPAPRLFEQIAWGSPAVLRATRARSAELGLSYLELRTLPDLDTPEDYDAALAAGLL